MSWALDSQQVCLIPRLVRSRHGFDEVFLQVKPMHDLISRIDLDTGNSVVAPCMGRPYQCHSVYRKLGSRWCVTLVTHPTDKHKRLGWSLDVDIYGPFKGLLLIYRILFVGVIDVGYWGTRTLVTIWLLNVDPDGLDVCMWHSPLRNSRGKAFPNGFPCIFFKIKGL